MAVPKQNTWILGSFDLNSVLTRQTSEKVAYKPGLDHLLLKAFSRVLLPESSAFCQKFLKLGRLQPPPPQPVGLCLYEYPKARLHPTQTQPRYSLTVFIRYLKCSVSRAMKIVSIRFYRATLSESSRIYQRFIVHFPIPA